MARQPSGNAQGRPRPAGPPPAKGPPRRGFFAGLAYWTAVLGLWGGVAGILVFLWLATDLPDPEKLWARTDRPTITYLDVKGRVIQRRGAPDAAPIDLDRLKYVPSAVIAIEDRKFWSHWGFDVEGIARAVYVNINEGRFAQGGSTITQQLAKNLFLSPEQSIRRKAQELLLAIWLEARFSKEELLSLYLSRVYFGAGAWGVEDAARRYFDKRPEELTLAESALLAGLLKAPSRLSPISDAERAQNRATVVLDVMAETGAITEAQRLEAVAQPVRVVRRAPGGGAGWFLDWVAEDVGASIGEPTADVFVETTLDLDQQLAGERALIAGLSGQEGKRATQGALVAMAGDGAIRAMVGGKSYDDSAFNRATTAQRQPGSAFKPFVYLAAIEAGYGPFTTRVDKPVTIGNWTPQNYDNRFRGEMTLEQALAKSINTIAVQLSEEVGRDAVIRTARRSGITSRLTPNASLALGSDVVTPMELTAAYAPFANGGDSVTPYGVRRIRDVEGRVLWERRAGSPRRVIDDRAVRLMNLMMSEVVNSGTGTAAKLSARPSAGKTGTTSDYRDAWFVGYTGGYVAAVWVGDDDNRKMARVAGGGIPARVWRGYMESALAGAPARGILLPEAGDPEAYPALSQVAEAQPAYGFAGEADPALGEPVDGVDPAAAGPAAPAAGAAAGPPPASIEDLIRQTQTPANPG